MRSIPVMGIAAVLCLTGLRASGGDISLTIYNQNFAVVRDTAPLDLKKGVNRIRFTETTAHLEPDSVMLRDPAGKRMLQILEQNYRADPVSEGLLLNLYEGKTIDFLMQRDGKTETVKGKIVRSGYVPHGQAMSRYGQQYYQTQMAYAQGQGSQPIIEVDGQLRFSLPGIPLFPSLADDTILKPTLQWIIETDEDGPLNAELCYVTGGMTWEADYNMVAPEEGDVLDLVGWVTMDNQCGKTFEDAKIKLMAGDVSKIQRGEMYPESGPVAVQTAIGGMAPPVSEKAFEEYHLYTVARRTTLHDRETKQVEFVRAAGVQSQRKYVYDGFRMDQRYSGYAPENIRQEESYGTLSNPKVWVMREFANTEANHLGLPLPKGRVRFYRRDADGQLEFTGENLIDHTPRDETVRVYVGNAFDLVGERRRTDYKIDTNRNWLDESFEIKVRNHKKEPVQVKVVEHLYRWITWEITAKSDDYQKKDSQTIEFPVQVEPDKEKTVTYSVHYTW